MLAQQHNHSLRVRRCIVICDRCWRCGRLRPERGRPGGSGTAEATGSSGTGNVTVSASATGGAGGDSLLDSSGAGPGGAGGDATASSKASSSGSGGVSSSASATGGGSGTSLGSSAGAAGSASATSAATSGGSGGVNSTATADGGTAGDSFADFGFGPGVAGGEADATSLATSNGSGSASSKAMAAGGGGDHPRSKRQALAATRSQSVRRSPGARAVHHLRQSQAGVGAAMMNFSDLAVTAATLRPWQMRLRRPAGRRLPRRSRRAVLPAGAGVPPAATGAAYATSNATTAKGALAQAQSTAARIERTGSVDRKDAVLPASAFSRRLVRRPAAARRRPMRSRRVAPVRPSSILARRLMLSRPRFPTRVTPRR